MDSPIAVPMAVPSSSLIVGAMLTGFADRGVVGRERAECEGVAAKDDEARAVVLSPLDETLQDLFRCLEASARARRAASCSRTRHMPARCRCPRRRSRKRPSLGPREGDDEERDRSKPEQGQQRLKTDSPGAA